MDTNSLGRDMPRVIQRQIRSLVQTLNQPHHLDGWDLTVSQWKALIIIGEHPSQGVSAVGKALGIGLPASSLLIDRLVRAGLVNRHRSTADRRIALCSLTDSGKSLYEVVTRRERQLQEWLELMAPEDLAALNQGLSALGDIARERVSIMEGRYHGRND